MRHVGGWVRQGSRYLCRFVPIPLTTQLCPPKILSCGASAPRSQALLPTVDDGWPASEHKPQANLAVSGRAGTSTRLTADDSEGIGPVAHAGTGESRRIEGIKELGAKLQGLTFSEVNVLCK